MVYTGVIIEESLGNVEILKKVNIVKTEVDEVKEGHKTPWLKQWTMHTVEVEEEKAEEIAEEISKSFDPEHPDWYADFKNETTHFIIFPEKVFKIDRTSREQYQEATNYGISIGIPDYQLDFSELVKHWNR